MLNYPVEKHTLRFYKYKFLCLEDDPVQVEAFNRKEARVMLRDFILNNPKFQNKPIISETVSLPIVGFTTKNIDNIENVWIGKGWMPLWEYEKLNLNL